MKKTRSVDTFFLVFVLGQWVKGEPVDGCPVSGSFLSRREAQGTAFGESTFHPGTCQGTAVRPQILQDAHSSDSELAHGRWHGPRQKIVMEQEFGQTRQ